tara:strand:- start:203 stop:1228 length:1026 start_codon:yes stop_codon:yes gene_type:complete
MQLEKKKKSCAVCGSKSLNLFLTKTPSDYNFYLKALCKDTNQNYAKLQKKIKKYKCKKCFSITHIPWFDRSFSNNFYNEIYGQHNYGWKNLYNFKNKNETVNHGNLFSDLYEIYKFKNYAEFKCPFSGFYFDIFLQENKNKVKKINEIVNQAFNKLKSRQLAHLKKIPKKQKNIKKNIPTNNRFNKFFLDDESSLCWGSQCISKSCNCKSIGKELFNYKKLSISDVENTSKFDFFGVFMTLDHFNDPLKKIIFGIQKSNVVLCHCHINPNLTLQHQFSFTKKFSSYLDKNKIFNLDITNYVIKDPKKNKGKNYLYNEMYLLISKEKKYISKAKNYFFKKIR